MTPSDGANGATEPRRDAIQRLAEIVSRGHAAVTVLIEDLHGGSNEPMDVRPFGDETANTWAEQIADALGDVRGRVVAVTAQRPALAARIVLGLAERFVDTGTPVTVVDGSIEEPVFAKGLPEDGDEGLVDAVLFGVSSSTVARRTLMHGVRLVTAGSYPISVPAVLGADAYRTTLEKLAREDATVLVVLPASYAAVAAAASSQLVIVGRDLPVLERLTRDLRSTADLRDVRFVAVLSAPEPAPLDEAPPPHTPDQEVHTPEVSSSDAEEDVDGAVPSEAASADGEAGGAEEVVSKPVPDDGVPVDDVARRPALVTANTAFVPDSASQPPDDPAPNGGRPTGRRWGALITVIVVLLIAGVAWRTGILDAVLTDDDSAPVAVVTPEEAETEAEAVMEPALLDSSTVSADDSELPTAGTPEAVTPEAQTRDWRALAVSEAVPGRYVVFTSSHRLISAAERDADTLERRGFPSRVVDVEIPERGMWHRVAVDAGFRTLDDTRELLDIMKEVGYEGAWIERLRKPELPVVAPPDTSERWMDEDTIPQ